MQGHIYRSIRPNGQPGRWRAVIDLPATPDGRRRQKTTTHDTKRDAQAWLARTVQELRAGEVYDSKLTVAEYLTNWIAGKQGLRPSTRYEYQRHLSQLFIPELGHLKLLDLRAHHIEEVFRRIADSNPRRERPVRATTMRRILATLNSALTTAVRRGLIRRNPAANIELPRAIPARSATWTSEQVATFLASTANDPLHVLYRLLVLSGLRRGEVVGLQWGDLDLDAGTLTIRRQVVSVNGELHVGPPKSDTGIRTIALDRATQHLLTIQHRRLRIQHLHETDRDLEVRPIFTRPDGEGLNPTSVSHRFTTLTRQAGLPRIRLHDLRHTSASLGLAGGENLLEVSRRLGHSSIGITADTYLHVSTAQAATSAQRLADLIDRETPPSARPPSTVHHSAPPRKATR